MSAERSLAVADLHALFDDASFGVVAVSAEGIIEYVNRQQCENSRLPPESLLGKDYRRTFGATMERSGLLPLYDRLVAEGVPFEATLLDYKRHVDGMSIAFTMRGHRAGPWFLLTTVVERTLAGRQARYLQLFENANDGIFILSREGKFLEVNRRYAEIVGIAVEKLIGQTTEIVMPGRFAESLERVERVMREGRLGPYEVEITTPFGARHLSLNAVALLEEGKPVGVINIVRDMTTEHERQEALRENERRLAEAQEFASLGSFEWDLASGRNVWSDQMYRIFGLAPGEFEPTLDGFLARIHPDDRADTELAVGRNLASKTYEQHRFRIVRGDGSVVHVRGCGLVMRDADDRPVRVIGTVQDVTETVVAKEQKRETEERFRNLVETLPIAVIESLADGTILSANPAVLRLLGFDALDELLATNARSLWVDPTERERLLLTYSPQQPVHEYERRIRRRDGKVVWVHGTTRALFDDEGGLVRLESAWADISERKEAEQALRESERRLAEAQEVADIGSFEWDLASGRIVWSDQMYRIYGLARDEFVLTLDGFFASVHPDEREAGELAIQRTLQSRGYEEHTFRIVRPDGSVAHVCARGLVVRDADDRPVRVVGTNQDVTETTLAKEQAREAETRYRDLVESLPIGVMRTRIDGTILSVNPAGVRLLGYADARELLAIKTTELYANPADRERMLRRYSPGQPTIDYEIRVRRKDGSVFWARANGRALFDDDGRLTGLESVWEDITERRAAEEELKESEERFRTLAALAPVSIFQTDAAGRGVYTNERWQELTGLTAEQGRGEGWIAAVHPEDRGRLVAQWQRCIRERRNSFDAEFRFQTPRGDVRWVRATARPIRSQGGEVVGYIGAKHDVSEQRAIEQMRSDFVAMLTHDLKNPLATVLGFAELLEEPRRRDRPAILHSLQAAATRALGIANNFLDYTRIESSTLELRHEAAQLNLIVRDVVESQEPAAKARGLSLEMHLADDVPELMLDESLFGRALTNLVGNAIKFSPKGGRVTIGTARRGGRVVLTVRDEGPGIAPADRGKLFQRFGPHSKLGKTSTGLGLFIVKSVVDAHGGEVAVECPTGGGAVFRISLPAADGDS